MLVNRKNSKVIVLGSGESLGLLSKQEIDNINTCEVVIALNKYAAFYEKLGIVPTHIYFVDDHGKSLKFLQYIVNKLNNNGIVNVTYILNKDVRYGVVKSGFKKYVNFLLFKYLLLMKAFKKDIGYLKPFFLQSPISLNIHPESRVKYISITDWLEGGEWATNLNSKLFHFRASITTVLNFISIEYPNYEIMLLGTDLNSSKYFFQEDLENINIKWKDWTYSFVKEKGIHFTALEYKGTSIFDKFNYINNKLEETNNKLFCNNIESLLVKKGGVEFKSVSDWM